MSIRNTFPVFFVLDNDFHNRTFHWYNYIVKSKRCSKIYKYAPKKNHSNLPQVRNCFHYKQICITGEVTQSKVKETALQNAFFLKNAFYMGNIKRIIIQYDRNFMNIITEQGKAINALNY